MSMKEITLKVKDINEYVYAEFGNTIANDGFRYKKTSNEFSSKNGDVVYLFNILLTAWSSSYSITVRLWITHNKVEDIFEAIVGKWRHRLTFSQTIERIYYSPDGRKIIKGEGLVILLVRNEDVNSLIETLKNYYNNIAKPYFDRFKTLDDFDDFINNPPFFEYSPAYVGSNTDERCMKGLITAKLVNNPNYKQLVTIYDELINQTKSKESISNYKKVKAFLG